MGSASKIILVGATSLIVGIYAISLKKVQTNDMCTALVEVKRVQFERVQAAAVRTAIDKFISPPNSGNYDIHSWKGPQLGGGTDSCDFTGTIAGLSTNLSITVYQRNADNVLVPRTILATVETGAGVKQGPRRMHRGTWQVTKYYVQREH